MIMGMYRHEHYKCKKKYDVRKRTCPALTMNSFILAVLMFIGPDILTSDFWSSSAGKKKIETNPGAEVRIWEEIGIRIWPGDQWILPVQEELGIT